MLYNCYRKKLLVIADYTEAMEWLEEHHFKILGIVCDGLRGLAKSLNIVCFIK